MDLNGYSDEKLESRLYIGNLDLRITEAVLIKMFSPYGKIISEEFLWHTHGPKRGEPRGYAFIQFCSKEEAIVAKDKMHGRMACGRPLVVRLASEKYPPLEDQPNSSKNSTEGYKHGFCTSQPSRSAKIAAIKNKLKTLEGDGCKNSKRQKQTNDISNTGSCNNSSSSSSGR